MNLIQVISVKETIYPLKKPLVVASLLFGIGLLTRLLVLLPANFDGLYGQDAFAYYGYGIEIKQAILHGHTPGPMYWPLGFPLLLGLGFMVGGISPTVALAGPLLAGAASGSMMFLLVYDLAVHHLDWEPAPSMIAGTAAGLLILFCGQSLQSSLVIMADIPALLWSIISAWGMVRYRFAHQQAWHWLALASLTLALATITRWIYGLLIIPWVIYGLDLWHRRWRDLLVAGLPYLLILLIQFWHSQQNPVAFQDHQWLVKWDIANAVRRDFTHLEGSFHYVDTNSLFYARIAADQYYLHALIIPLLIVGAIQLIRHPSWQVLLLLSGWLLLIYGFLIGIPYQNIRFALSFFPPLAILAGLGIGTVWQINQSRWAIRLGLILVVAIALWTTYQNGITEFEAITSQKQHDLEAIDWAYQQMPPQATVYVLSLGPMLTTYHPDMDVRQIYYESPERLHQEVDLQQPVYVFVNVWALEHQWSGQAPWQVYDWFGGHSQLVKIGQVGSYTLFHAEAID